MKFLTFRLLIFSVVFNKYVVSISHLENHILHLNVVHKDKQEVKVLSSLTNIVINKYLSRCHLNIIVDDLFGNDRYHKDVLNFVLLSIQSVSYEVYHISRHSAKVKTSKVSEPGCRNYMILCHDLDHTVAKFGYAFNSRVFVVTSDSKWHIKEFFNGKVAQHLMDLLVADVGPILHESNNEKAVPDINLYTHDIYVDSLGNSVQKILTTWKKNRLTRPEVNLYPSKLDHGFQGHRFILSAIDKPPLIFRSSHLRPDTDQNDSNYWDGIEIRLLRMIAQTLNFTLDIHDASFSKDMMNEPEQRIINDLIEKKADFGLSGIYITNSRYPIVDFSPVLVRDCGTFLSLGSFALSKYRAIFGPFHWSIWFMVLFTYILAIFPIAFTNNQNVKMLCNTPKEIENMCCYMFGTFTNLFTFKGTRSWTNTKTGSTRLFIGTYWIFTIIITTAYTSSIIAFITLPAQPMTADTSYELMQEKYRTITLNKGVWKKYLNATDDIVSKELFKNVKFMTTLEDAMDFIVKTRFILDYAFLGSKISLTYLSQSNFIEKYNNRKIFFHVGSECYIPFNIGLAYKKNFQFRNLFGDIILRSQQSGLLYKIKKDIEWEIIQGSKTKQSLTYKTKPVDRQLTLDDVQGMFVLLVVGMLVASFMLTIEYAVRWWTKKQKARIIFPKPPFKTSRSMSMIPSIQSIPLPDNQFRPLSN
ncbi:ionotropic receptor 21a [Daktulosphaira vitifoliae]|uniref:ionotropic receptor 21a n=1 Tax=Daktulosphaira vitifoliae TaxID=58002 RepID=UPI0021A9D4A5|nr:ionotropic receptor 21a [Daktulosphaira vitifoliae]